MTTHWDAIPTTPFLHAASEWLGHRQVFRVPPRKPLWHGTTGKAEARHGSLIVNSLLPDGTPVSAQVACCGTHNSSSLSTLHQSSHNRGSPPHDDYFYVVNWRSFKICATWCKSHAAFFMSMTSMSILYIIVRQRWMGCSWNRYKLSGTDCCVRIKGTRFLVICMEYYITAKWRCCVHQALRLSLLLQIQFGVKMTALI